MTSPANQLPTWPDSGHYRRMVPQGVTEVLISPPCKRCGDGRGYKDTRYGTFMCAMCGASVKPKSAHTANGGHNG